LGLKERNNPVQDIEFRDDQVKRELSNDETGGHRCLKKKKKRTEELENID